jgi:hypothetical protein
MANCILVLVSLSLFRIVPIRFPLTAFLFFILLNAATGHHDVGTHGKQLAMDTSAPSS